MNSKLLIFATFAVVIAMCSGQEAAKTEPAEAEGKGHWDENGQYIYWPDWNDYPQAWNWNGWYGAPWGNWNGRPWGNWNGRPWGNHGHFAHWDKKSE
jgi:hypothetical protein